MSAFDFAAAPRSFSRIRSAGRNLDGAMWCHLGVVAGLLGLPAVPPHRWGLDWVRCFESLGVALGQHEVRRLELNVAQQAWMKSPIARRQA
jgi:hypothetical protein